MAPGKSSAGSRPSSSSGQSSGSSSATAPKRMGSMLSFQPSLSFKPVPKPANSVVSSEVSRTKREAEDRKRMPPPAAFALGPKIQPVASSSKDIAKGSKLTGKGKEKEVIEIMSDDDGDDGDERSGGVMATDTAQMWTELYAPQTQAELAPGKARILRVRNWLHESLYGYPFDASPPPPGVNRDKIRKYKRVLLLSGPAGSGKTTSVRLIARDMGVEILEWGEGVEEWSLGGGIDRESSISKFTTFLSRQSFPALSLSAGTDQSKQAATGKPRLILLTALPNLSHAGTREAFHASLLRFCKAFTSSSCPIVIVHSDAGAGGRAEESWMERERGGREGALEVLGREVRDGPWCQEIDFLPLAPTFLNKALLRVVQTAIPKAADRPSHASIQLIALSSHGDLRAAINSLQMVCSRRSLGRSRKRKTADSDSVDGDGDEKVDSRGGKRAGARGKGSRGGKGAKLDVSKDVRAVLDAVTRKEQSLGLFHALGKVFYNKRLHDPNMEDADEEQLEMIRRLPADDPLPDHLRDFTRQKSLTQMEAFIPSIPVDASSFTLWLHQSFPSFCENVEQVATGLDDLCTADVMRTDDDLWQSSTQAIAYSLHLSVRGIQMALPSPVPRRSQKVLKPQFFEAYRRERDNVSSLENAARYITKKAVSANNEAAEEASSTSDGVDRAVWGGVLPKRVVINEVLPLMVKIQSATKRPLLPSSAQSLVLRPISATLNADDRYERLSELTAKDGSEESELDETPLDHVDGQEEGWDEDEDVADEKEDESWLQDDDIVGWD
ncbi:hypothetical protein IAU60_002402 [Kwoniella sp. DSM 27419]